MPHCLSHCVHMHRVRSGCTRTPECPPPLRLQIWQKLGGIMRAARARVSGGVKKPARADRARVRRNVLFSSDRMTRSGWMAPTLSHSVCVHSARAHSRTHRCSCSVISLSSSTTEATVAPGIHAPVRPRVRGRRRAQDRIVATIEASQPQTCAMVWVMIRLRVQESAQPQGASGPASGAASALGVGLGLGRVSLRFRLRLRIRVRSC